MERRGARLAAGLVAAALAAAACGAGLPLLGRGDPPERSGPPVPPWEAPLGRSHPLAGRLFDPRSGSFVPPGELVARAGAARFVLVGERHDHPDHHRLQAWLVERLGRRGAHGAIAFEMLSEDLAGTLEAAQEDPPVEPDALARRVGWPESGWPPFELYRPVFRAALATGLRVRAADLPSAWSERLRAEGLAGLEPAVRERLALERPLPEPALRALTAAVRRGHCDMLPEAAVERLAAVQRARDAHLADALVRAASARGAILVAGNGHVRRRRGVPVYLGRRRPAQPVLALGLLEVERGAEDPAAYLAVGEADAGDPEGAAASARTREPALDLVWFTPRLDDRDPCALHREKLERLRESAPGSGPEAGGPRGGPDPSAP